MPISTGSSSSRSSDLRALFDRWAQGYTNQPGVRQLIVERAIMIATHDEELMDVAVDQAMFSIVHRVAQQQLMEGPNGQTAARPERLALVRVLRGKRILIAEDDYAQASELADAMRASGVEVIGPFPRAKEALIYLKHDDVDGAILDLHLFEGKCLEVADTLMEKRTPFVFLTGYDRDTLPSRYANIPHYLKPYPTKDLASAIARSIGR